MGFQNWVDEEDPTMRDIRSELVGEEDGPLNLPNQEDWAEYSYLDWQTDFNIKDLFKPPSESPLSVRSCRLNVRGSPEAELGEDPPRDSPITPPQFLPEEEEIEEEEEERAGSTGGGSARRWGPLKLPNDGRNYISNKSSSRYPPHFQENRPNVGISPSILAWEGASPVIEEDFRIPPDIELGHGSPIHLRQLWENLGLGHELSQPQEEVDRVASPGEGCSGTSFGPTLAHTWPGPDEASPSHDTSPAESLPELFHINDLVYDPRLNEWKPDPRAEHLLPDLEPPHKKLKLERSSEDDAPEEDFRGSRTMQPYYGPTCIQNKGPRRRRK